MPVYRLLAKFMTYFVCFWTDWKWSAQSWNLLGILVSWSSTGQARPSASDIWYSKLTKSVLQSKTVSQRRTKYIKSEGNPLWFRQNIHSCADKQTQRNVPARNVSRTPKNHTSGEGKLYLRGESIPQPIDACFFWYSRCGYCFYSKTFNI